MIRNRLSDRLQNARIEDPAPPLHLRKEQIFQEVKMADTSTDTALRFELDDMDRVVVIHGVSRSVLGPRSQVVEEMRRFMDQHGGEARGD
jgi:hypothetical protein